LPFVDSALGLARRGFRVFPLEPGAKIPVYAFAWKDLASSDVSAIRSWWRQWPDANIGVATGRGLVVLDADVKGGKRGLESLDLLDALGLPDSLRVATPSGGVHVYLRCNGERGNSVASLKGFPDIDVRGDGGFVVGPGSMVNGVEYKEIT
jgi:hypothetical protein